MHLLYIIMKIFLLGTCRIHRPFFSNLSITQNYNILNIWESQCFVGPIYNIKEVRQFLEILINDKKIPDKILYRVFTDYKDNFDEIKLKFHEADTIIIEISTNNNLTTVVDEKKYILNLYNADTSNLDNYSWNFITNEELEYEIIEIKKILENLNKKILFVSQFNNNNDNIYKQEIIDTCEKVLDKNIFFNPTYIVNSNLPDILVDDHHYSNKGEILIMEEFHKKLKFF